MANDLSDSTESSETPSQRRMTTDPDRIREWAEERDAVPVSTRGGEGHGHTFARREDVDDEHEEHTWDEFEETFTNRDLVFVYEDEEAMGTETGGLGRFDLLERDEAFNRADLGRDELEDQLRQGETVTTEIVETQVIEREVVERDTIESEVVDTELADRQVVDSELLSRDIAETEFVTADMIEVTTDETRLDTIEEIERYTVESEVVDVDLESDEELESDEIETGIELESVQRSILESNVVQADIAPEEVIEREVIESKRGEGDTVRSELIERRTVEEEIHERTRQQFTLEETDLVESEVVGSDIIEGEIIDVEEYESITAEERSGAAATETEVTTRDDEATAESESPVESGPTVESESGMGSDATTDAEAEPTQADSSVSVSKDDQGKVVVDESGQEIGIASRIQADTVYIDPEPGLADRLKARLGWGNEDEDEYPVEPAQIKEVTDDEIVIRGD
ncbi:hypothetical protein [Halopiger xanaduensis]|uniref:DUF2382 domain-containing protein n=1 Tax=Halopiger xanaduensis (strain DSM 18323 / JCM 14033 / SH-6) TaxID=797210 RepID=F8DC84_HALXS|nr:hypothetical protein [Halopiger xanaduensis]AEH37204.1 hypothetical protein Halxa_2586 [Halopiger xanaduensis SH-6]